MIVQQGSLDALNDKHLKITWNIISFCNFKCPYCLNMNSKRSMQFLRQYDLHKACENIFRLDYNSFEIYLLGGEPTLFPELKYLLSCLLEDERVKRIYIITNGSTRLDYIVDDRIKILVSVHPLSEDKIVIPEGENTYFNLLAYPKVIDDVRRIFETRKIDEITVVRRPPLFERPFEYSEWDKEWILKNDPNRIKEQQLYLGTWEFDDGTVEKQPPYSYIEFNYEKYLRFEGMYCMNNSLNIDSDGYWRYACYDTKLSETTVFEAPIQYKPYFKRCEYQYCHCAGRLNIIKLRDKSLAYELNRKT